MRRFWRRGPRGAGGGGGAITQRPGLAIEGRRRLLAHAMDEPHPTPMRTPAALLRRTGRLCRGQCPGRSRYSWVPGTVAIRQCVGLTPRKECPVRPGSRSGRVVRRLLLFSAALRWGSGGFWESASARNPFTLGQLRADPVQSPDPPPRRGLDTHRGSEKRRARPASHQSGRLPGLRPRTPESDSWSTDNGLSSLRLAPSAPVRRRLAGRAAAQCLTKRLTSNTSFVCNRW